MPGRLIALLTAGLTLLPSALFAERIVLSSPPQRVNDGDTFEADLNGNGRLETPKERVRLLYVDTPELWDSRKGRDLRHGLPAKAFLRAALAKGPIVLRISPRRRKDKYGRTLAQVQAAGRDVNLGLIRQGHSYFDTRFRFPAAYERYAKAEGAAFRERLGIWSTAISRKSYLRRLRKEGKTPRAEVNPLYLAGMHESSGLAARAVMGKYLRVKGRILKRKLLSHGGMLLRLPAPPGQPDLLVYASPRTAGKLRAKRWKIGSMAHLEGFFKMYKGQPELVLHYGRTWRGKKGKRR